MFTQPQSSVPVGTPARITEVDIYVNLNYFNKQNVYHSINSNPNNKISGSTAVLHEIGHAHGLAHTPGTGFIMTDGIVSGFEAGLTSDKNSDLLNGIQCIHKNFCVTIVGAINFECDLIELAGSDNTLIKWKINNTDDEGVLGFNILETKENLSQTINQKIIDFSRKNDNYSFPYKMNDNYSYHVEIVFENGEREYEKIN